MNLPRSLRLHPRQTLILRRRHRQHPPQVHLHPESLLTEASAERQPLAEK